MILLAGVGYSRIVDGGVGMAPEGVARLIDHCLRCCGLQESPYVAEKSIAPNDITFQIWHRSCALCKCESTARGCYRGCMPVQCKGDAGDEKFDLLAAAMAVISGDKLSTHHLPCFVIRCVNPQMFYKVCPRIG